jgi:hypothetical protein
MRKLNAKVGLNSKCEGELSKIRVELEKKALKAEELYRKALSDIGPDSQKLLDPTLWIMNQEKMRESWYEFLNIPSNGTSFENIVLSNVMFKNSFSEYMQYMYDTYPIGFGKEVVKCYDNGLVCDGAKIYSKLINSSPKQSQYQNENINNEVIDVDLELKGTYDKTAQIVSSLEGKSESAKKKGITKRKKYREKKKRNK